MKLSLKSNVTYWAIIIIILTSALLLWGWSVAVENLIHGTTVVA